jgi:hypothetical protein
MQRQRGVRAVEPERVLVSMVISALKGQFCCPIVQSLPQQGAKGKFFVRAGGKLK